jgi:hypothetical protein
MRPRQRPLGERRRVLGHVAATTSSAPSGSALLGDLKTRRGSSSLQWPRPP